jgi:hypothetical protein
MSSERNCQQRGRRRRARLMRTSTCYRALTSKSVIIPWCFWIISSATRKTYRQAASRMCLMSLFLHPFVVVVRGLGICLFCLLSCIDIDHVVSMRTNVLSLVFCLTASFGPAPGSDVSFPIKSYIFAISSFLSDIQFFALQRSRTPKTTDRHGEQQPLPSTQGSQDCCCRRHIWQHTWCYVEG